MNIFAFAKGKIVKLENVNDPVFKEKMLGDGIAILPSKKDEFIYAPFDGEILLVTPTLHAVGLVDTEGKEFLIHIGLETVSLKGKGFKSLVKDGDKVKAGDKIMKVDWNVIESAKLDFTTMLVNTDYSISNFESFDQEDVDISNIILVY